MSREQQVGSQLADAFIEIRERKHRTAAAAEAEAKARAEAEVVRKSQENARRSTIIAAQERERPKIQERLREERNKFESLSDDDLAFEAVQLAENIEILRSDLYLHNQGKTDRPEDWQPRAERALIRLKGQAALCRAETERRARTEREDRQRLADLEQQLTATLAFIRHAKTILAPDVFEAIWAAVDAENEGDPDA